MSADSMEENTEGGGGGGREKQGGGRRKAGHSVCISVSAGNAKNLNSSTCGLEGNEHERQHAEEQHEVEEEEEEEEEEEGEVEEEERDEGNGCDDHLEEIERGASGGLSINNVGVMRAGGPCVHPPASFSSTGAAGVLERVAMNCPELMDTLEEFGPELDSLCCCDAADLVPFTNAMWLSHLELMFVLRSFRLELFRALRAALTHAPVVQTRRYSLTVRRSALRAVDELASAVEMCAAQRLSTVEPAEHPLVLQLTRRYKLSAPESLFFQLLFVRGASVSNAFHALMYESKVEEDTLLCSLNAMELEEFLEDKRAHITEGVILEQEKYDGSKSGRMSLDAVSVLMGRPLKTDQRLKLSRTELLNVVDATANTAIGLKASAMSGNNAVMTAANGLGGGRGGEGLHGAAGGGSSNVVSVTQASKESSAALPSLLSGTEAVVAIHDDELLLEPPKIPSILMALAADSTAELDENPHRSGANGVNDDEEEDDEVGKERMMMKGHKKGKVKRMTSSHNFDDNKSHDGVEENLLNNPMNCLGDCVPLAQVEGEDGVHEGERAGEAASGDAAAKHGDAECPDHIMPSSAGNLKGAASKGPDHTEVAKVTDGSSNEWERGNAVFVGDEGEDGKDMLTPYNSSLEYLDDSFQVLSLLLRIAAARHDEDMKEAGSEKRSLFYSRPTKVSTTRELQAKLKFARNRLKARLEFTEAEVKKKEAMKREEKTERGEGGAGGGEGEVELPRLEALARKLGLDEFEKEVVVMLTGISISPVVKSIFLAGNGNMWRSAQGVQVKDVLSVHFDSFKDQVLARTYFYKSSRLVSRGVIKVRPTSSIRGGDLMEQEVELDRRILDWIVGLDTDINELVEGSHLYTPLVGMSQVVLPEEQKEVLLRTVENFSKFKEYRKRAGLQDVITYGSGLVILLCGASGTGKTMSVNAVAHHLGKKVLLVDFNSLTAGRNGGRGSDSSADLRGLFRDAEMNDAIIFFDECESIFGHRTGGGDHLLNALLMEIERTESIIMLATNRPVDLDEAMHRRITLVSEFRAPDHMQRQQIWKLAAERIPIADGVDWEKISLRYELTGGYIKNALMSALLLAISRDSSNPLITEEDIASGCAWQIRGNLQMKSFAHRVVPKTGLDELVLSKGLKEKVDLLVGFEKARGILLGQWGMPPERLGTAALFWGPSGTGKSSVAEAIGFELGRPLMVINCAQLISGSSASKTNSNITAAFNDAQLMDAVLVLEDFQILRVSCEGVGSVSAHSEAAIGLILYELGRFLGTCILIANNVQGSIVHRLDHELVRRLRFIVEFKQPDPLVRRLMWRKMVPEKVPLADDVCFAELGKRFEFSTGAINSATMRAVAKAALRPVSERKLTQKDLIEAAEVEKSHLHDEMMEMAMRSYV